MLVSGGTYSAAEGFALTMKGLPNVTFVGEPTGGIFSDAIGKTLPNGWRFTLSSEIYSDLDGHVYEGSGIPVDHVVDFIVVENVLAGKDPAILNFSRIESPGMRSILPIARVLATC